MTQGKIFLVVTGIVAFKVNANTPQEAIQGLKERIQRRGELAAHLTDPEIGMSLVEALSSGRLNFIAMNEERTQLLGGEFQGVYEETVSRRLADSLRDMLSENLYYQTDFKTA